MTALDQAFIRAFTQDQANPTTTESAAPVAVEAPPVVAETDEPRLAEPVEPPAAGFEPALQVDSFAWPSGCTRLGLDASEEIGELASALAKASADGKRVVGVSGGRRGDGCTTLLLCAARRLADQDHRVALVDADFDDPLLARRLGLLPESGWEKVVADGLPLEEVAIDSVQDRLALVPLCGTPPSGGDSEQSATKIPLDVLGRQYDLVLVDLGPIGEEALAKSGPLETIADWIDGVILVHNVGSASSADLDEARRRVDTACASST